MTKGRCAQVMIVLRRLVLIFVVVCLSTCDARYTDAYIDRRYSGDVFSWADSCDTFNAAQTYIHDHLACMCSVDGADGSVYNGSFYKSRSGNYKCYYGMGQVAGASLTLDEKGCTKRAMHIPTFANGDNKMIFEDDQNFIANTLKIKRVQYFSYHQNNPFVHVMNPFRIDAKATSDFQQQQQSTSRLHNFRLRWATPTKGGNTTYAAYKGHILKVHLESFDGRMITNTHTMLIRIPGERKFIFSFKHENNNTTMQPASSTTTSTTTTTLSPTENSNSADECIADPICTIYYNKWITKSDQFDKLYAEYQLEKSKSTTSNTDCNNINIGLGIVCGILLLIIIILLICLCRNDCCKSRSKPKESIVISSPSPVFIPPRRGTNEKPPVAPARTITGPPPTKNVPKQPLYESIHRKNNDDYETPIDNHSLSPYQFENLNVEPDYAEYQDSSYIEPDPVQ